MGATSWPPHRWPSMAAVLGAHALLLAALWQLMPAPGRTSHAEVMVAWLSLPGPPAVVPSHEAAPKPLGEKKPAALVLWSPPRAQPDRPAAADPPAPAADSDRQTGENTPPTAAAATPHAVAAAPAPAPDVPRAAAPPPAAAPVMAETSFIHADHAACTAPAHPAMLRERGIEGVVRLRVQVDAQGHAAAVQLQGSSGWRLFDEAALAQVRGCRFRPAQRNGVPVDSWVEFPMRFALAG